MATRETSAEIEAAATAWAALIDRAPLCGTDALALDEWLAGETRRVGAFARAQAMMVRLESARALGPSYDPEAFLPDATADGRTDAVARMPGPMLSRRRLLQAGGSALALSGAAAAGLAVWWPNGVEYASAVGKVRSVTLADGTILHLNTASAIEVQFSASARTVLLKTGEVLFDIAHDINRPFIVLIGRTSVEAIDTVFSVRRQMGEAVRVMVRRGVVKLRRGGLNAAATQLNANMLAQIDADQAVPLRINTIDHAEIDSGLSWLEGSLTFRDTRLDDAADEFARYNNGSTIEVDPALREHRISGAFAADDPEGFARAVATSYGLRLVHDGANIRLLSPS